MDYIQAAPTEANTGSGIAAKKKKKRTVRAHHEDLTSSFSNMNIGSSSPNIPIQVPIQTPPMASNQFSQQNGTFQPSQGHQQQSNQFMMAEPAEKLTSSSPSISESRYYQQLEYTTPIQTEDGSIQYPTFLTFQNVVPPVSGTQIRCFDQGTASPKFIRSTMYNVPESEQLRAATKLPISVTIRPFAPLSKNEAPIPVVDMSQLGSIPGQPATSISADVGPPRCHRCRTYMNPAMQHNMSGKFSCNICQFDNNSYPQEYFSPIDPMNGNRIDVHVRPELHSGVYDFIVPSTYNVDENVTHNEILHHVFLIDISEKSIKNNLPVVVADSIRATLYSNQFEEDESNQNAFVGKVAIITFDKKINFYNLSPYLEATQLSVLTDLEDPFIPFYDGLFADPEESRNVIEDCLNHLESLCQTSGSHNKYPDPEPCFAAACRTAMLCLKEYGKGGKITSVLSALPSWGPGRLKYRDNRSVGRAPTPEMEKRQFNPDNEYYHLLASDFVSNSIGLDCLVVSDTNVDLSNIGWLCSATGGSVNRWPTFNYYRDARVLTARFKNSVINSEGYQGQLKVRCSNGLQVAQYYGTSSSMVNTSSAVGGGPQDPIIPVVNQDQSFTILFDYDGKLNTKYDCHFQAAMLYTDKYGIRKVRVINLVLAVSERLEDVFNFVEQDAVVATLVRDTLSFVGKQTFLELRESVNEKLVEVFTQYRAMSELGHNKNRALTKQLLFPDSLKHLPMYLLCFIKTRALRQSSDVSADSRLADIFQMLNSPIATLMYKLYPALIELHSLRDDEGIELSNGFISLPHYKSLTMQSVEQGVYLLCNGDTIYVWIQPSSNILLLKDLFGDHINSINDIDPLIDELPDLPTLISTQARNLVRYFQTEITGCPSLGAAGIQIAREGIDATSKQVQEYFVEDNPKGVIGTNSVPSYADYLSNLHKAIRVKLENDKSSNTVRQSITSIESGSRGSFAQRLINF
ncbi:SED5-binding protein 3 [[Candida] railenensis]|uniref:SED5-binding protein 3 n=1 Tax=[Candida] railenensis TaxID=45579 RepID=A0A9P0VZP4_9ASCO|nr:SED5-binding protein 3 [[Candida] railenensis]